MTIDLSGIELGALKLSDVEARLALAIGLYAGRKVSLGRAARIAGIPYVRFMEEMGKHGVCLNYGLEDLEHDLRVVDELMERSATK